MKILLLLVVCVIAVLAFIKFRPSPRPRKAVTAAEGRSPRETPVGVETPSYAAVSIEFTEHSCTAAKNLMEKRFLVKEAPPIPLPDCDAAECRCTYKHYADRRNPDGRRDEFSTKTRVYTAIGSEDRRTGRGRRKTDRIDASESNDYNNLLDAASKDKK